MAKLSDAKKVELLETTVLSNNIEEARKVLETYSPIEFTAKAIGLACRFSGADMVEALLEGGATLNFALTPTLKRKYDCKISINKFDDVNINFAMYLFPEFEVEGYDQEIISEVERQNVLKVLYEKDATDIQEMLYYAILYNDSAILDTLSDLGVNQLSDHRTDIVAGRVPMNRLDAFGRNDKREFQEAVKKADEDTLLLMLKRYLKCMNVDKIILFPADFYALDFSSYPFKNVFISRYCSEKLFDFFIQKTSMLERVKTWELLFALVEQNNASGIRYALAEQWISKPKDLESLLTHAQDKKDVKPELIGYILEKQGKSGEQAKKKEAVSNLSLNLKPLSATELKKIWGTKKLEDGTLIITSYKGEELDVVVPALIGKTEVTAIDAETFSTDAPRISEAQQKTRANIISVEFPGSIKSIPKNMFYGGYYAKSHNFLKRIILNEGVEKIGDHAFDGCSGIEEITIPNSVKEIGNYAFHGCQMLKKIQLPEGIESLPTGVFSNTGFVDFVIPETVINFGEGIFRECADLSSVKLPDTMKEIPNYMFLGCTSLLPLTLSDNISAIGGWAFSRCSFEKFVVPESVKAIGSGAFSNCENMKAITLPREVNIANEAFSGCKELANNRGQIVVNGILFGILDSNGVRRISAEGALEPLIIGNEVNSIAVSEDSLPEIVCRECTESGNQIDVSKLSVGDEILFGRFPETEDYIMKPLKWRVLDINDDKALLITVQDIISLQYDLKQRTTWADYPVRKLLNDGFYNTAFTELERKQIVLSMINTPKNKKQRVDGGPDTEDRVFLLSMDEVEKYMLTEESRKSVATEYAHKQHPTKDDRGYWQLRTPGNGRWGSVAISDDSGTYCASTGNHVGYSYLRPAMWIK